MGRTSLRSLFNGVGGHQSTRRNGGIFRIEVAQIKVAARAVQHCDGSGRPAKGGLIRRTVNLGGVPSRAPALYMYRGW